MLCLGWCPYAYQKRLTSSTLKFWDEKWIHVFIHTWKKKKRSCFMSEKISNYIFHLKVYVHIFSPMWNEMLTTLVSHLALFFQKSKPSMQLLLMLKTRSKRPKLKTDLSLRIRGVCQDSTLTHEIFDNYYFGSKRLEKHCNPTSNWVYNAYWQLALRHRSKGCKVGRIWTF